MKRDMDLVRAILLEVERSGEPDRPLWTVKVEGQGAEVVRAHVRLLAERGLLNVAAETIDETPVIGLTWEGHDFLDSVRDDSVWVTVKRKATAVGGTASFEVFKAVAVQVVRSKLGLREAGG